MRFICLVLLFIMLMYLGACAKKTEDPNGEPPVNLPEAKFWWQINNGASTFANESYFIPAYSNIVATKTDGSSIDIILNELNPGTYSIAPFAGITLDYNDANTTYPANAGRVVISENTGILMSGSFTCTFMNAGTGNTLTGGFSDVPGK